MEIQQLFVCLLMISGLATHVKAMFWWPLCCFIHPCCRSFNLLRMHIIVNGQCLKFELLSSYSTLMLHYVNLSPVLVSGAWCDHPSQLFDSSSYPHHPTVAVLSTNILEKGIFHLIVIHSCGRAVISCDGYNIMPHF